MIPVPETIILAPAFKSNIFITEKKCDIKVRNEIVVTEKYRSVWPGNTPKTRDHSLKNCSFIKGFKV
jgi:hypothetical protein